MESHDVIVRIAPFRIKRTERSALHRNNRLGSRRVYTNGIPKLRDLNSDVKNSFVARCKLDYFAVVAKCRDKGSRHYDAVRTSGGGNMLINRAIC